MNSIAFAVLVFALGLAISMAVAGIIFVLFLCIQLAQKRRAAAAAAAADSGMPVLRAGEGGVLS